LRRALSDRADELQRTEEEKARIASEKSDVAQAVAVLEADLRRVKRDAEAFGRDLKTLRAEKEKMETVHKDETSAAERARKQAQAQIRVLNERLEVQQDRAKVVEEQLERHVCSMCVTISPILCGG
jgi:chromosome segregation ATPase